MFYYQKVDFSMWLKKNKKINRIISAFGYEDLVQTAGTWTKTTILNSNTPIIACTDDTCDGEFNFTGTKFYLTGVRGNDVGEFEIFIDDDPVISIKERQSAKITQNNSPVVLFQSDELEFKSHKVKIHRTVYDVLLVNLLYSTHPWLPSDIVVDNDKLENERFDKVVVTNQTVSVTINVSTFTGIEHNENGGAIHVVNAGFKCEKVEFDECKSEEAGGAIYLNNSYNYDNLFVLDGLTFDKCEAKFGGAVYIYSSSKNNQAIVRNCIFTNNDAYLTKANSEDGKYGGSAIFMTARNGLLSSNILRGNKGDTAVKLYNHFDKEEESNKLKILENDQAKVLISNCKFEISKESSSCLYYFLGNDASPFELRGCSFSGKLASNAHYIDGQAINKLGPKLIVKSCRFAILDSKKAFNMNSMKEFLSVDLKDQVFEASEFDEKKGLFRNWKIIVAVVVPAALVATLAILLVVVLKRKNKNVVQEFEMASQSIHDIDESQNTQLNLPLL